MVNEEEINRKTVEIQLLEAQLQEIEQQLELIDKEINEFRIAKLALDEVKKGKETLAQVGKNIFTKTKIVDDNYFLVEVGFGVFCRKNREEVKKFFDEKENNFEEAKQKITEEAQKLVIKLTRIKEELAAILQHS